MGHFGFVIYLLGIIAFLIWKQYLNKTNDSGSCGNV